MEDIPALLNQLLATAPSAARPSTRSWEKSFIFAFALLIPSVFWVSRVSIRPNRKCIMVETFVESKVQLQSFTKVVGEARQFPGGDQQLCFSFAKVKYVVTSYVTLRDDL